MKLSKNLGRIATTFLATAMLAGLTAVPASAAGIQNGDGLTNLTFRKELILPANVQVPSATFDFTLEGVSLSETVVDEHGKSIVTTAGTGSATTAEAVFGDTTDHKDTTYNKTGLAKYYEDVQINLPESNFSEPGIYTYQLKETTKDLGPDYKYTDDYNVYVYVTRATEEATPKVTSVVLVNGDDVKTGTKTDVMTNYYMTTPDPDGGDPTVNTNEMYVENEVTGKMGNKTEPFKFTVKITGTTGKKYTAIREDANGSALEGDPIVLTSGTAIENIELANGQKLHIYGLSSNDQYEVTEQDANENNYVTTIDNAGTQIETGNAKQAVTGTFKDTELTVKFKNDRSEVAPTGLVMNVAPYVLLVLVAAGAGYVFLRKREED